MIRKKKPALKTRAKKVAKKAKKAAKTDVGRAGIGGGIGALALGPVGAVAGAGIAMATKKKRGRKKNPEPTAKLSSAMGNLLLDYHKVSDEVEHVAASALRGERVEIRHIKKARDDLRRAAKEQPMASEKEQMGNIVEALGRVLSRHDPKTNPVRAPSLKAAVRSARGGRARKAAAASSKASKVASEVAAASLRRRMAKINPGEYSAQIPRLSDSDLEREHKALSTLIRRAKADKSTTRMSKDLQKLRSEIVSEKRRRRNPKPNPVSPSDVVDKTLADLTRDYRKQRTAHLRKVASPGTERALAKSKDRLDAAEQRLILYAQARGMTPNGLQEYLRYTSKKLPARKKNPPRSARSSGESQEAASWASEVPHLGTLGAYPRAVYLWESAYINARATGKAKADAAKIAWSAIESDGYYRDSKGIWHMPRRRFNPSNHPKKNPLQRIPKRATEQRARSIISKNIATEAAAGRPQNQAVAIALSSARRDAPKLMAKMYPQK